MRTFLSFFWHYGEGRFRAILRLVLGLVLMALVTGGMQLPLGWLFNLLPVDVSINLITGFSYVVLTGGVTLGVFLVGMLIDRRKFADYGLRFSRRWWQDFAFGLALGAGLMALIFGVELGAGMVTITGFMNGQGESFWAGMGLSLVLFICVGIQEELTSRGYLITNLAEGLNGWVIKPRWALGIAFGLSSVLFGYLHAANPGATPTSVFVTMLAGIFLGLGFMLTGQLAIPIGLHIAWNFFQGNVFGFPVSGSNAGATFVAIQQGGPEWLTGGAYGPEAGVIGLLAIALGSALTVWYLRRRDGKVALEEEVAIYHTPDGMG